MYLLGPLFLCLAGIQAFFRAPLHPRLETTCHSVKNYPYSRNYYERYLRRLNSRNITIQNREILNDDEEDDQSLVPDSMDELYSQGRSRQRSLFENGTTGGFRIIIPGLGGIGLQFNQEGGDNEDDDRFYGSNSRNTKTKSDNFEVVKNHPVNFTHIGGYDNIKQELMQCVDLLSNYTRYHGYNVRVPKGLIFEGPPGNGKTLFAKALAGEAKVGFIAVSGSEFQEKYVGVGSSRIRELFKLAKENIPCIIFIDEIDAVGRKRAGDGETSSSERDSTLNELLVGLDGFKNSTGIFLIGATNRADLLDTALTRPGRVDKRIYIDNPDKKTRLAILNIHKRGKPMDPAIQLDDLVEQTSGYSAAQIENFLNEAMLNALRRGETRMYVKDIEEIANKMMVGWQPTEHQFTADIIDHIAVHEMGHAVVGMLCKHHSKVSKVLINLSAPNSPAYTIFENAGTPIMTREALLEHLMILLGGRIAEEVFYNVSVTTGAINDFEEALKLAEKMIVYYGMGDQVIYPSRSETYKEYIDDQVSALINEAYACAEFLLHNSRDLMYEGAEILKREKVLKADTLTELINNKHRSVLSLTAILAAKQPNHP